MQVGTAQRICFGRLYGGGAVVAKSNDPKKMRPPKVRRARMRDMMLPEMLEGTLCCARLIGDGCVLVENHRGLCDLGQRRIAVATTCGILEVCGDELMLCHVRQDALLVRGRIARVGYAHG